ncbi:hypothetical protein PN462_14525 [Spirulina sp. CS-785/01]|uniref:hypothetical protein n=1 Tax=Spirulina sp. CS-785/01 TaxID=3021716 RepID=UPI002330DBE4|nr:hypothetical protein [Spirulina sp. CS-785/01]MDB9314326.1 hypothetical protein [Spirulina sp. CS-785/01]
MTLSSEPSSLSTEPREGSWYLGIDLGSTQMAAVLCDCVQGKQYPLYWSSLRPAEGEERQFWLPMRAFLSWRKAQGKTVPHLVVGKAVEQAQEQVEGVVLERLKGYLRAALPYYSRRLRGWEPKMVEGYPLTWFRRTLQALLTTLTPAGSKHLCRVEAVGLSKRMLSGALMNLEGVMVSCPAGWSDTYRFNVREAILGAKLVQSAARIGFVEESVAVMAATWGRSSAEELGELAVRAPEGETTLLFHGGLMTTELALVTVPKRFTGLKYQDFALRSLDYGMQGVYEDIFYQLIYPQWQPEQEFLRQLRLEIPRPGEGDRPRRDRATVMLQQFEWGPSLLEMAKRVWLILQKRESFTVTLGAQNWGVQRQDLVNAVLNPLQAQFNQRVNELLSERGVDQGAIAKICWSGGTLPQLQPFFTTWLSEKFPQAKIVTLDRDPQTSLVARGLATLPQYPQLIHRLKHQYSDYFLLWELVQSFPERMVTLEQMLKILELRGINPRACMWRIFAILEGYLPPGLLPDEAAEPWFTAESLQNLEYQALRAAPLFAQDSKQSYRPNPKQGKRLRQFLTLATRQTQQNWDEPLTLPWSVNS